MSLCFPLLCLLVTRSQKRETPFLSAKSVLELVVGCLVGWIWTGMERIPPCAYLVTLALVGEGSMLRGLGPFGNEHSLALTSRGEFLL